MSDFETTVVFLLQTICLLQGCISGLLTVQLIIHAKNQKNII